MIRCGSILLFALGGVWPTGNAGDWSQWRGSQRNGVVSEGVPLLRAWPGPLLCWRSETIPSGDDGGHGGVVVADGKTYISLVWHDDERRRSARSTRSFCASSATETYPAGIGYLEMEKAQDAEPPSARAQAHRVVGKVGGRKPSAEKAERNGSWIVSRFKRVMAASLRGHAARGAEGRSTI